MASAKMAASTKASEKTKSMAAAKMAAAWRGIGVSKCVN
jgi:hypothetical protein